jgi:O-antigen/teichoic acid export membrane protein
MSETATMTPEPSLIGRVLRGSLVTMAGFGATQAIRLIGNLILARLLFPEAFGIMALVTVLMVGLAMLSDLGISPAIQGSRRGDDPDFLDTAWTLNLIRGGLLFAAACALAWPMAAIYNEPLFLQIVPVVALSLIIHALEPTRIDTAERHLMLGRVTALELASQVAAMLAMVGLALATGSIWAMVAGSLVQAATRTVLAWQVLPGRANRLRLERPAAHELIHFGKWIFLSTVAGFLVQQADKLVLGRYLSMAELGIYNIGFFLASFPLMLGTTLVVRLMIPVYRQSPPGETAANFARLRRIRGGLTVALLAMMAPLVLLGPWIVGLLYDPRYAAAGGVVVLLGLALMPQLMTVAYDRAALAQGDSLGFFLAGGIRAAALVGLLFALVPGYGIAGAAAALAGAALIGYPAQVWLARRHGAWDPAHDLAAAAAIVLLGVLAVWLNAGALGDLVAASAQGHGTAQFVTASTVNPV